MKTAPVESQWTSVEGKTVSHSRTVLYRRMAFGLPSHIQDTLELRNHGVTLAPTRGRGFSFGKIAAGLNVSKRTLITQL